MAAVGALAALPTAAVVGMNLLNGTGGRNAEHLRDTGGTLADLAVEAWAGGRTPLLYLTVALAVLGAIRGRGVRVVGATWVLVPLVLLLLAELVRPVYLPRYLLAGLLGLGVLAAAGALAAPRGARAAVGAVLVGFSLLAAAPLADREPRERSDRLVDALADLHRPGEPVVGADLRSSMGLDHYVRTRQPDLRADLLLPPGRRPAGRGPRVARPPGGAGRVPADRRRRPADRRGPVRAPRVGLSRAARPTWCSSCGPGDARAPMSPGARRRSARRTRRAPAGRGSGRWARVGLRRRHRSVPAPAPPSARRSPSRSRAW